MPRISPQRRAQIERERRSEWNAPIKKNKLHPGDVHGQGKTNHTHHHSTTYKEQVLRPFIQVLEMQRKLGRVILDIGSGSMRVSDSTGENRLRAFYPTEGKKIIRVDLAFSTRSKVNEGMLEIQADIENTGLDTIEQKKRLLAIAKFLKVDPRKKTPHVDSMLLAEVLNYVNYRRAIMGLLKFVKPGGRIIIYNRPRHGFDQLYSRKRPRNNDSMIKFLERIGLELELVHYESPEEAEEVLGFGGADYIPRELNMRTVTIIARKKK